ncbi:asparaginase [Acaricomes phytoseiuli]|uniref:asparaginase n=1 Tax=Acaricomes phytoseiuli TaxID=291968 RepID=UPI000374E470|nr:asparaginase [Acaricomes phytoseiuli]MCW1248992.1 asparaginase [Acaricomes phytoseiuli]
MNHDDDRASAPDIPAHSPVAVRSRNGATENVHYGTVIVYDGVGQSLLSVGDPEAVMYLRSALKPFQLLTMVQYGLQLPARLLALAVGSHNGAPEHLAGVSEILTSHGLREADLIAPEDFPFGPAERREWLAKNRSARRVAHCCSGKHAAMLATCVVNGWSLKNYSQPQHPLQLAIRNTIETVTKSAVGALSVDGCGAPAFALPLDAVVRAFGQLAAATSSAKAMIANAMRRYPEFVAGAERDVTTVMQSVPGLLAKDGADGIQLMAFPSGAAIGVKIADGADAPRMPVTLAALEAVFPGFADQRLRTAFSSDLRPVAFS